MMIPIRIMMITMMGEVGGKEEVEKRESRKRRSRSSRRRRGRLRA